MRELDVQPAHVGAHVMQNDAAEDSRERGIFMANQNGRNAAMPDENRPSWRPQDEGGQRSRRDDDERYMSRDRDDDRYSSWEDRSSRYGDQGDRMSSERYGQGQSGYGSGRYEEDRSFGSRNLGY